MPAMFCWWIYLLVAMLDASGVMWASRPYSGLPRGVALTLATPSNVQGLVYVQQRRRTQRRPSSMQRCVKLRTYFALALRRCTSKWSDPCRLHCDHRFAGKRCTQNARTCNARTHSELGLAYFLVGNHLVWIMGVRITRSIEHGSSRL